MGIQPVYDQAVLSSEMCGTCHTVHLPVLHRGEVIRRTFDVLYREGADSARVMWSSGTPFDSVVALFHDPSEERNIPDGIPVDSLPVEYRLAVRDKPLGAFTEVFALPDPGTNLQKFAVAQITK